MVDVAEVYLWGELVGAVSWNENTRLASFEYAPRFLDKGWDLSPIKMPLSNGARIYSFPELRKGKDEAYDTFKGLPGLLADALPDRYGNQLINIWLTQQGRPENSMNPVEQLCFIGKRAMGALEFEPAQLTNKQGGFNIEIDSLVKVAHQLLAKKEQLKTDLSRGEKEALRQVLKVGTSAGGARPKAVIAFNESTGEVRSGQVDAPKGFEHWLLKLDGVSDAQFGESTGWGRIEYAYYLMATSCGIDMMPSKLLEENGRAHFMTKRFDREGNDTKHHVQTLCGLQHYDYNSRGTYSYEQVFQTMRILRLTYPEAEQMFRRMVFNVLAKNCDDHTKNFAFMLKKGGKWQLTPAYDVCYAYNPVNFWLKNQTMLVRGKQDGILKQDLLEIAKENSVKRPDRIIDEIQAAVSDWPKFAKKAGVDHQKISALQSTFPAV
ncbi:type II toxin-antitoxin system HipA family toxin [uncultured Roseivirga sp.]|uniref:type II toxin-antitoxin system HipA family toxin n=1 Tax=uncultured Roseivirga sp. TaxID=543088 RepID=UPI000D7A433E|nr:type II toxin-antitoxin system HipA family toxin [uncultured Roseivirga sp.]PWL28589.1 MAG: toxin HipA [Roseivirga sp. XM-24bin3]